MSRPRIAHPRERFLIRLDRALRKLGSAVRDLSGTGLDNPDLKAALIAGGGSYHTRLRHPSEEARFKGKNLRAGGRQLAATDPYAQQFFRLLDINVSGPSGLTRRSEVLFANGNPAQSINDTIDAAWLDFWRGRVTADRRLTGPALEHLYWRTRKTDGEVFVRMLPGFDNRHGLALQFVDPDQIDVTVNREAYGAQREIRMGIELDEYGAPTGYLVTDTPAGAGYAYGAHREPYMVPAFDPRTGLGEMLHGFDPSRANQARGISSFSSVLDAAEIRLSYSDAELRAAQRSSAVPWAMQARSEIAADLMPDVPTGDDPASVEQRQAIQAPSLDIDPEKVLALPPGWELSSIESNHPTSAYSPFMNHVLREFACGMGPSFENLCNNRENSTYSSNKMGALTERGFYAISQQSEIDDLMVPVSMVWLRCSILRGVATDGREGLVLPSLEWRRYLAASFDGPEMEWPEPLKEVQAAALEIQLGLSSRTEIAAKLNKRWADVAAQLAHEQEIADELGISVDPPGSAQADAQKAIDAEEAAGSAATNGNGDGAKAHATDAAPTTARRLARLFRR